LVVGRGLIGDLERWGPTNPQPTPYQPPMNTQSTQNKIKT